jgi:hypothetical protein
MPLDCNTAPDLKDGEIVTIPWYWGRNRPTWFVWQFWKPEWVKVPEKTYVYRDAKLYEAGVEC